MYYRLLLLCVPLAFGYESDTTIIRKVGYPEVRVNQRQACGQREVSKSFLDPDYAIHTMFGGFKEGTCEAIGYTHFEKTEVVKARLFPFGPWESTVFHIYSRDPTAVDVAGCILRDCDQELDALGSSAYAKDVAHCVSPAFGPCVPKAWDCLGNDQCRKAVECLPALARDCGQDALKAMMDPKEREKLACMWNCNNSKTCIAAKCGKAALECLTGIGDRLCHDAFMCIPKKMMGCSATGFKCVFNPKDSICRENLACLAKGAGVCADPALNLMTDESIANVMYCANDRCPAVAHNSTVATLTKSNPYSQEVSFPSWPGQLGCMGMKCGSKVVGLLLDKDIHAMSTCLLPGLSRCDESLWDCLGDKSCQEDLQCWISALNENAEDIWKMVTDKIERSFDEELYACEQKCVKSYENFALRAFCVAGKCGLKSTKCLLDSTCRHVFTDLPFALGKCGTHSALNPKFREAAKCAASIASTCGRDAIELLRDRKLADVVACNSQCTHAPANNSAVVV